MDTYSTYVEYIYSSTWIESNIEHKFRAYVYSRRTVHTVDYKQPYIYSTVLDIHTYRHAYSTYIINIIILVVVKIDQIH